MQSLFTQTEPYPGNIYTNVHTFKSLLHKLTLNLCIYFKCFLFKLSLTYILVKISFTQIVVTHSVHILYLYSSPVHKHTYIRHISCIQMFMLTQIDSYLVHISCTQTHLYWAYFIYSNVHTFKVSSIQTDILCTCHILKWSYIKMSSAHIAPCLVNTWAHRLLWWPQTAIKISWFD